jgi:hypothetical protein
LLDIHLNDRTHDQEADMSGPVRRISPVSLVVVVSILLLAVGCGGKKDTAEGRTKPKGRILQNGLPVKVEAKNLPPGDPGLQVTFIQIGTVDAGEEIDAQIIDAAEGTFELIGADAKGIPPGKYRVALLMAPAGSEDRLKGKFSREKSKIEVEVKEGEDLVIDIAQYK